MTSLAAESWTWYSFVLLVVLFRYTSRITQHGGIKGLEVEDGIMLFVMVMYTILVAFMNIVAFVDTNLIEADDIPLLTPQSINDRIYGSKLVLLVEQAMITTQWGCKICLLLLYSKLTFGLWQHLAVKVVAGYVVVGWLVMEILYFGVWCKPFDQYWAVPVDNIQCSAAIHHLITNAVFNISSDLMMLCIPIPLLITSTLPTTKKLCLCILFSLGGFVILCAVLNKYYSFSDPFSPMWTFWYIREASTALLVANIPNCWPLMRRIFNLHSFNGNSTSKGYNNRTPMSGGRTGPSQSKGEIFGSAIRLDSRNSESVGGNKLWASKREIQKSTRGGSSVESLRETDSGTEYDISDMGPSSLKIWHATEVTVDTERGQLGKAVYDGLGPRAIEGVYDTKTTVSARNM